MASPQAEWCNGVITCYNTRSKPDPASFVSPAYGVSGGGDTPEETQPCDGSPLASVTGLSAPPES